MTYLEHSAESEKAYLAKRAEAKKKFGQPFAYEPGSSWKPHETPILTQWLAKRMEERK